MRSSAPEGPHAPRAKQTPPSGSSGATAGPAGATPTSPRPQPSASIQNKAANQSQIRSSASIPTLSSQNRGSSHPRNISSHPQLQRSQPRSTQSQNQTQHQQQQQQQQQQLHQKSPPLSSSSGNSQNTNLKSSTASLSKGIQPRLTSQTNQKTSPQALPKSQSSFNSAPPSQSPSQAIKAPSSIKQGSSSTKSTQQQSPSSSSSNQPPNFGEYDDQEWDVNVGHLIIDLDADIAQADRGRMSGAPVPSSGSHGVHQSAASGVPISEDKHSLKMKIKRTKPPTKTSEAKHEIVKPDVMPASAGIVMVSGNQVSSQHNGAPTKVENNSINANTPRGSAAPRSIYKKEKRRIDVNGTTSPPPSGSPSVSIRTGGAHSTSVTISQISTPTSAISTHSLSIPISCSQGITSVTATPSTVSGSYPNIPQSKLETSIPVGRVSQSALQQGVSTQQNNTSSQSHIDSSSSQHEAVSPVAKRKKLNEESKRDACVGTSVATITEPECLGPCEPGSSVTLEGIVWHETEGGVLVVNVTWRGKTYVGTLLDCTKHDWAPPRFCDSPTSDLESRTPKGRAKRGRAAATTATTATATTTVNTTTTASSCSSGNSSGSHGAPTELSITETRSGKLRNASTKGRRGNSSITFNPPLSPVKSEPTGNKRKAKEIENVIVQDSKNKKAKTRSTPTNGCSSPPPEQINQTPQQAPSPPSCNDIPQPPESPQLIECPAQNCGKKYRHVNGLKYHQSHAHSSTQSTNEDGNISSLEANDEKSSPPSPKQLASSIVDTSQELVKPSALRPNVVIKSEDDNLSPAFESLAVQHSNSAKSPQHFTFPNSMSVNAQKQSNSLNSRLNTVQSEGQSVNVVNLNGLETSPNQHSKQDPSLTSLPQPNTETIATSHNSLMPPSTQAIIVSQAKPSHEEQSPQYSSICHQSSSQQTITPVQVQPNAVVVSQQSQTHSAQQQSLPSNTMHAQVTHSQNMIFNSQHGLQQKPIQISAQHQQQQQQPPPPPPQPSPQQQQQHQQLNQPHLSQQQSSGQSPQQLKPQVTHPQAQQAQNFKIQSNLSTTTTQPIVSYPVQMHEHSQPSHPSHQIIHQSPSRAEVKPEILNRMNPVHNSSQILSTNRPPPLITLSDTTPPPSSVTSTPPVSVPQGTQLSSLPGSSVASIKIKQGLENEKLINLKPKDLVNGLTKKDSLEQEEEPVNRDDARSPAYSDISDANDTAPVIDEDTEAKEFKEDNKKDLPIGGAPPYAYGLYLGGYGQPHPPYLMPPLQHPQSISLKAGENKDLKDKSQIDKSKKDYPPVPGTSDYMKFPAQYLYSQYSAIYAPGYPDPYIRDPIYKDVIDKAKAVESIEDNGGQEEEKGPTDLSRNSMNLSEKSTKDMKPLDKVDTSRIHQLPTEKRTIDSALAYRYINPYESRVPLVGSTIDKTNDAKSTTPIPLSSPRLGSTPPSSINSNVKEEKIEKPENKNEGVKPTMETTGPPPPPTSTAYYPPFPYAHVPFDPYRPPIVPGISLAAGFPPYLAAAPGLGGLRYQLGVPSGPEDLSPNGASGSPMLPSGLYTGPHKIAELQETQKPPPSQPVSSSGSTIRGGSPLSIMQNSLTGQSPHSMQIVSPPFGTPSQQSSVHLGERKTPPVGSRLPGHPSLPEGYPYPILSAQYPPHFSALGVSPTAMSQVGVGGPGVVPSGMGGGAPQPK